PLAARQARGEPRIVALDGIRAHQDRVHPVAQVVSQGARALAADPARLAAGGGDLAVETDRPLRVTQGIPVRTCLKKGWLSRSASCCSTPVCTEIPARRNRAIPFPFTSGLGSEEAEITRRTPASMMARVQGGVRP